LLHPWQRLFAVEYTDYRPVEFDKFIHRPDKYQARGPNEETRKRTRLKAEDGAKCSANITCTPFPLFL
jgi:hypothetical protein